VTYRSECENKVRFLDRKAAKLAIRRTKRRDHRGRLNAYPCSWCPFFHVGHFQLLSRSAANRRRTSSAA
jgi:hypothetical protein